jgi:O-antigen ligase
MSKILLLGIIVVILFVVLGIVWPTVGLVGYMCVSLMKTQMRVYVPWLFGFWGYILDMGTVCVAILGIWWTHLRERKVGEIFVPRGIWVCLIVLIFWIWIRLPATRDLGTGIIKALVFSIFDTATIILGLLYGRTEAGLRRMVRALIAVGIIAVIGILVFGSPEQGWEGARITFGNATPLAPADFASYLVIALTGFWLAKRTFISMAAMFVAAIFATGTILVTGTRGPFLTLASALLVTVYFYRRQVNLKAVIAVVLFLGLTIFAFRYYLSVSSGGIAGRFRLEEIQSGIMVRVEMVKVTLSGWANSPILGTGPGDFTAQMMGYTMTRYPHNVILELANELGLIGLIPYLVLLYYGFRSMKLLSAPELDHSEFKMYAVIIFGVFIYHFVASFKTGSYAGSNIFYLSLGATISMTTLGSYEYMRLLEYRGEDDNKVSDNVIMEQGQEQEEIVL